MKKLVQTSISLVLLAVSNSVISEESCKKIYESPVSITVDAKQGDTRLFDAYKVVTGNSSLPNQPATAFYQAGDFRFKLTPLLSCNDRLILDVFINDKTTKKEVSWNQETAIVGKAGTDYFVNITAKKI